MRALKILRQTLDSRLDFLHAKTRAALWRGVDGVMQAGQLWLTALGRGLPGRTTDKHRIKAADRLIGNIKLHPAMLAIYAALAAYLMKRIAHPCISIDWTGVGPRHYLLSASLSFEGRGLPIFSRIYPLSQKGSPKAAKEFLKQLKTVIPESCTPILITDAGFYHDWFDAVQSMGWDLIGRLRGTVFVQIHGAWRSLKTVHRMASRRAQSLGVVPTNRTNPRELRVVLSAQRKPKGRKNLTAKGTPRQSKSAKNASRSGREPWVLATTLSCSAKRIVALYAQRMQIEECFRDLKTHRFGWSLDQVRSRTLARIEVLLLLAALALVVMHYIGLAAERAGIRFHYQANTIRKRRTLSTFFLARLLMRDRHLVRLTSLDLRHAIATFEATLLEASALA